MVSKTKAQRKTVSFDESEADQQLLNAIATELQASEFRSFGELCKASLRQYLLDPKTDQSMVLLMELQRQLTQLQSRVDMLEAQGQSGTLGHLASLEAHLSALNGLNALNHGNGSNGNGSNGDGNGANGNWHSFPRHGEPSAEGGSVDDGIVAPQEEVASTESEKDPLLDHLGTLLDDF